MNNYSKSKAHYHSGLAKCYQEQYDEAITEFDKAIELFNLSDSPSTRQKWLISRWFNDRGRAKYELGKHKDAILDFNRSLEYDRENKHAENNRENAWHHLICCQSGVSPKNSRYIYYEDYLKNPHYVDYLNSVAWEKKKEERLQLDGHRCVCGMRATEVHHKTYSSVGKELLSELVALCKHCHDGYHGNHDDRLRFHEPMGVLGELFRAKKQ